MDDLAPPPATPGTELWIPVNGRTLSPLARPGERARVRACGAEALRSGDLALLWREGSWAVRMVTGTRPLRTATLRGPAGPEAGEVRGRVVALEREGRVRRYGAARRLHARLLRRAIAAGGAALARTLRERLRDLAPARALRRHRLGPLRARRLDERDREALHRFASRRLPHLAAFLDRQLCGRWRTEGIAVGAFAADGRMVGFVFLDEYLQEGVELPGSWVRALSVAPEARRLGVGRLLVEALCAEARAAGVERVYADVRASNRASLRLLEGLGFHAVAPESSAGALPRLRATHEDAPLVMLERALGRGRDHIARRVEGD